MATSSATTGYIPNTNSTDPTSSHADETPTDSLQRRSIHLRGPVRLIGKEANNIDEVQAGRYAHLDEIVTEYSDPADDHFHQNVLPILDHLSGRELAQLVGADRRTIDRIRRGLQKPRQELRQGLTELAAGLNRTNG
jgi:hypothetical protein